MGGDSPAEPRRELRRDANPAVRCPTADGAGPLARSPRP